MCHWDRQAPSPNSIVTIGRFKTRPPNSMVTMGRSETRPPNSMVTMGRSETYKIHRTHAKNIHCLILLVAFRLFDGTDPSGTVWTFWRPHFTIQLSKMFLPEMRITIVLWLIQNKMDDCDCNGVNLWHNSSWRHNNPIHMLILWNCHKQTCKIFTF